MKNAFHWTYFPPSPHRIAYHQVYFTPPPRLLISRIFCQTSPMRNLTATICLTLAVLLGSVGVSWSADFQKGLTWITHHPFNYPDVRFPLQCRHTWI